MFGVFEKLSPLADVAVNCLIAPLNKILKKGGYLALTCVSVIAASDYFREVKHLLEEGRYSKAAREGLFGAGWLAIALFIASYHLFDRFHHTTPAAEKDLSNRCVTEEAEDKRVEEVASRSLG